MGCSSSGTRKMRGVGGVGAITMCPAPSLTGVVYALMPVDTPSVGPQAPRKM